MIVVVDYGMGNLRSVSKALEHLGAKVKVSDEPDDLKKADKIVLPGVGAFGDAVSELSRRRLLEPLRQFSKSGKPFLGICLGLQLLFPSSEESPGIAGLGLFEGEVKRFQSQTVKIPHMGWNEVRIQKSHPVLKGIADGNYFYFVHSYYAAPSDGGLTLGLCDYGGEKFSAIVGRDHVVATQFHPEKSQEAGLALLKNFVAW